MKASNLFVLSWATLAGCTGGDPTQLGETRAAVTEADCTHDDAFEVDGVGGANFNTLVVDLSILPFPGVGRVLANDQIHMLRMAGEAGLDVIDKHVPAFVEFDGTGQPVRVHAGGFYRCGSQADCQRYLDDVVGGYVQNGVSFTDRPEFHGSFQGHSYDVIGGAVFRPVSDDYSIRIRRWHVNGPALSNPHGFLRGAWTGHMRRDACERGIVSQAYLLWSQEEQVVAEVLIGTRVDPPPGDPTPYFLTTFGALAGQADLAGPVPGPGFTPVPPPFTDTYLVITYWPGAFDPSRWPNSPSATGGAGPMPEPFCGDGSCNTTVTHTEDSTSCPGDCTPGCGDSACTAGETSSTCALDCLPF